MKVSVIIPTRNRAGLLEDCLQSLTAQTLHVGDFEVVVVDNGSTDRTAEAATRFASQLQLRYLHESEPGLHVGRHAGARNATSSILVFGDDDIIAQPTWLASVLEAFGDESVALVGGNNLPLFEHEPPEWLQRWWQRRVQHGQALGALSILDFGQGTFTIDPGYVWGCNFSIRKDVLLEAGGFHPDAMPSDRLRWRGDGETHVSDSIRRSGRKTLFHSGASVQHRVSAARMTPRYFVERSHAQGVSDSYADLRRHGARRLWLSPFRRRLAASLAVLRTASGNFADPVGRQLTSVRYHCAVGYLAGYSLHQKEVAEDTALRDWVLKENYYS